MSANQHVHDFLKQHHMGILSTVTGDNKPWGSAIYFVVDDEFNVFFVTRQQTFKYQNIEKNPFAALTVADDEGQTSVQLAGEISKVAVEDYMDVVFTRLAAVRPKGDNNWAPPVEKVYKGDYIPLRLTPTKLQYADFKELSTDFDHQYIEQII